MKVRVRQFSRSLHLWGALVVFLPIVIVIGSGLLLQVKKQLDWVQPPTQQGQHAIPTLSFAEVLQRAASVPEANIKSWHDIDRLDVRPSKGIIKVQSKNHVEVQLDSHSGEVLQTAYRRSNTIEAIHDGSWFFSGAKLGLFLPAAIVLLLLWFSGLVMLYTTLISRYKRHQARRSQHS